MPIYESKGNVKDLGQGIQRRVAVLRKDTLALVAETNSSPSTGDFIISHEYGGECLCVCEGDVQSLGQRWRVHGPYTPSAVPVTDFAGGTGTPSDPYQIQTAEHLDNIRDYSGSHFELIADIDMAAQGFADWNPLPQDMVFTLNGNGRSITNFNCERSGAEAALIGTAGANCDITIKRLAIYGGSKGIVTTSDKYCGYICGSAFNCGPMLIEDVLIKGKFDAGSDRGNGGIGINNNDKVTLKRVVGIIDRLAGFRGDALFYDFGSNSVIQDSYFDETLFGTSGSDGTVPKSPAELQQQSTYQNYDFVNVWKMGADHAELRVV